MFGHAGGQLGDFEPGARIANAGRPPGARTGDICDSTRHTAASSAAPATIPRDLFIFGMQRHANNLNTEGLLPPRNASRIAQPVVKGRVVPTRIPGWNNP